MSSSEFKVERAPKKINSSLFHRAQEVFALSSGVKRNAFLEIDKISSLNNFLNELKFFSPFFDYSFSISKAPDWNKQEAGNYKFTFCIGRNKKEVEKLSSLFQKDDANHSEIGTMLSYPFCCSHKAYRPKVEITKVFNTGKANIIDFRINNFYGRSGINFSLTRHYVCSYDCEKTINRVEEILEYLRKFPHIRDYYIRNLKRPILFLFPSATPQSSITSRGVIFSFDGEYKNAKELNYSNVYLLKKFGTSHEVESRAMKIYQKIAKGNKLMISKRGIDVYLGSDKKEKIREDALIPFWPKDLLKGCYYN